MTNRLDIGPIHQIIEEHIRPLAVALYERTGIEPHLTLGVSRSLGLRMQMLPGQRMEMLTEAGVVTVAVADDSAINIQPITIHADDPDRFAFGIAEAFRHAKVPHALEVARPDFDRAAVAPLTITCTNVTLTSPGTVTFVGDPQAKPVCACGDPKCGQPRDAPPVLVDGLTPEQCRDRWEANAAAIESGMARPYALSPEQIAEGKRLHLARKAER